MTAAQLNARFAIANVLRFEEDHGLVRLQVTTELAQATVYLQGAHLTKWTPVGEKPVIFFSRKSDLAPGKPMRGGIPIVFPWFSADRKEDRIDGHPGPSHGFARQQEWTLESAQYAADSFVLRFTLGPTDLSRSLGFDRFSLAYTIILGNTLHLHLIVQNTGPDPLHFEDALHAYFSVTDVHEVTVTGLEPTGYIDKTEHNQSKPAAGAPISFQGAVDRIYTGTDAPLTLHDALQRRTLHLTKTNSASTVVWNPWKELADLGPWDWHEMVCVEAANVERDARTLKSGETHILGLGIKITS